jgi:hypothetical protein
MRLSAFRSTLLAAVCLSAQAEAKPIKPGQYQVGANPQIQQICLNADGTWYGTTFTFGGHWINDPSSARDRAAIFGNYQVQDHQYVGYGNDTLTVQFAGGELMADWYDWYDDLSYQNFWSNLSFVFIKKNCDPPSTAVNTGPASE